MSEKVRIGIIICDRCRTCTGGTCLRAATARGGVHSVTRGGRGVGRIRRLRRVPGWQRRVRARGEAAKKNGATVPHVAAVLAAGCPPCPHLDHFRRFILAKFGIPVIGGTHPIRQKYLATDGHLGTWTAPGWVDLIAGTVADERAAASRTTATCR